MWEEKQKEPPGYALSFKGVFERYSLLQLFSASYFREVQEKLVMTQNSPVGKHDAIIQRARCSKSKGDITSHLAKKKKTKIKTRITEDTMTEMLELNHQGSQILTMM